MLSTLQLTGFHLNKLSIEKHSDVGSDQDEGDEEFKFTFKYDVKSHKDGKNRFRIVLDFGLFPTAVLEYYQCHASITGYFTFTEDLDKETMMRLLHLNGLSILYGILRGQLSMISGSFGGNKLNLPTMNIQEILRSKMEMEGNPVEGSEQKQPG